MGCNCKAKVNQKYLDPSEKGSNENKKKTNGLVKIVNMILQFLFGLFVGCIVLIGFIPAFMYILYCVCTGKPMAAHIPDLRKYTKH